MSLECHPHKGHDFQSWILSCSCKFKSPVGSVHNGKGEKEMKRTKRQREFGGGGGGGGGGGAGLKIIGTGNFRDSASSFRGIAKCPFWERRRRSSVATSRLFFFQMLLFCVKCSFWPSNFYRSFTIFFLLLYWPKIIFTRCDKKWHFFLFVLRWQRW